MSITLVQVKFLLEQQQKQFEKLIEALKTTKCSESTSDGSTVKTEAVMSSISEFNYDVMSGITFNIWYQKYEDLFTVELKDIPDDQKVRLLLRKLGAREHDKFSKFILPKHARDFTFGKIINILSQLFGDQTSLFNIRYNCLKMVKEDEDD